MERAASHNQFARIALLEGLIRELVEAWDGYHGAVVSTRERFTRAIEAARKEVTGV